MTFSKNDPEVSGSARGAFPTYPGPYLTNFYENRLKHNYYKNQYKSCLNYSVNSIIPIIPYPSTKVSRGLSRFELAVRTCLIDLGRNSSSSNLRFGLPVHFGCAGSVLNSPVHRFACSQVRRFTGSPVHRFVSSPVHRFASSPVRRLAGSPVHPCRYRGFRHLVHLCGAGRS